MWSLQQQAVWGQKPFGGLIREGLDFSVCVSKGHQRIMVLSSAPGISMAQSVIAVSIVLGWKEQVAQLSTVVSIGLDWARGELKDRQGTVGLFLAKC